MFFELAFLDELFKPSKGKVAKAKREEQLRQELNQLELANTNLIASLVAQGKSIEEAKTIADQVNGAQIRACKENLDSIDNEKAVVENKIKSRNQTTMAMLLFVITLVLLCSCVPLFF